MTQAAQQFVTPLSLQVVSGATVGTDLFDLDYEDKIGHIELARWPDVVLVAPATANFVGKLSNGLADDLLSTVMLATTAPVVIAPAMNTAMLHHPMVGANLARIQKLLPVTVVDPDSAELACKETGPGRMPDSDVLIEALVSTLAAKTLAGRRILVTVGPTRERLDDVRFLTNASSGKMGFAMCTAAVHLGAEVVAVAGPTSVTAPSGIEVVAVESAAEMAAAVERELERGVDIAVFTAAVCDATPKAVVPGKITKSELPQHLELDRTVDILASVCGRSERPFCVGFAAEAGDFESKTVQKCERKGADLMVGNDVSAGAAFNSDQNTVVVADAASVLDTAGPASKLAIARRVWQVILGRYEHPS